MDEDALIWALGQVLAPTEEAQEVLQHRLIGSTLVRAASPPPLAEIVGPELVGVLSYRGGRSYIDQMARLIVALCEPPAWLSPDDLPIQRAQISRAANIDWFDGI